jgi:hypothetical protein
MSKILDALYLGSAADANNIKLLKELRITHILIVSSELPKFQIRDFTYHKIHAKDLNSFDLSIHFKEMNGFIDLGRNKGSVFVHCFLGTSLSAAAIIAYLIERLSMTFSRAFSFVNSKRQIDVRPSLIRQLQQFALDSIKKSIIDKVIHNSDNSKLDKRLHFQTLKHNVIAGSKTAECFLKVKKEKANNIFFSSLFKIKRLEESLNYQLKKSTITHSIIQNHYTPVKKSRMIISNSEIQCNEQMFTSSRLCSIKKGGNVDACPKSKTSNSIMPQTKTSLTEITPVNNNIENVKPVENSNRKLFNIYPRQTTIRSRRNYAKSMSLAKKLNADQNNFFDSKCRYSLPYSHVRKNAKRLLINIKKRFEVNSVLDVPLYAPKIQTSATITPSLGRRRISRSHFKDVKNEKSLQDLTFESNKLSHIACKNCGIFLFRKAILSSHSDCVLSDQNSGCAYLFFDRIEFGSNQRSMVPISIECPECKFELGMYSSWGFVCNCGAYVEKTSRFPKDNIRYI